MALVQEDVVPELQRGCGIADHVHGDAEGEFALGEQGSVLAGVLLGDGGRALALLLGFEVAVAAAIEGDVLVREKHAHEGDRYAVAQHALDAAGGEACVGYAVDA